MELSKLRELVSFCRSEGIQYIKTAEVELVLAPSRPATALSLPTSQAAAEESPLPPVYKKLNPNYSNRMLFPGNG